MESRREGSHAAPINAHWEVTIYHNVTGVEMSTDQDGHVCKLITTDGWRKLHSPFPIQVCRSAADLDRSLRCSGFGVGRCAV